MLADKIYRVAIPLLLCAAAFNLYHTYFPPDPREERGLLVAGERWPIVHPVRVLNASAGTDREVAYWFATSCVWCGRNWENVKVLARNLPQGYRLVAYTAEDPALDDYVKSNKLEFTIVEISSDDDALQRFGPTPATFVVDKSREIKELWVGTYGASTKSSVEQYFNISLPTDVLAKGAKKRPVKTTEGSSSVPSSR